jgi:hypothetical protein
LLAFAVLATIGCAVLAWLAWSLVKPDFQDTSPLDNELDFSLTQGFLWVPQPQADEILMAVLLPIGGKGEGTRLNAEVWSDDPVTGWLLSLPQAHGQRLHEKLELVVHFSRAGQLPSHAAFTVRVVE